MITEIVEKFGDLMIPVRCPSCGGRHKFYYRWLHHSGGYCCPQCDRIVPLDLVDLDLAVMRLDGAIRGVRDSVNRVAGEPRYERTY